MKRKKYRLIISKNLQQNLINYTKGPENSQHKADMITDMNDLDETIQVIESTYKKLTELKIADPGSWIGVFIMKGKCPEELKRLSTAGQCLLMKYQKENK